MDTIVFDEADALPEVARSVADERIGLDGVAHIAALAGAAASEACRELARLCARETALGRPRLPIRHVDGAPVSDPGHLDYVARAIEAARERGRVLVLCTSYALAKELAARGRDAIVHVRGTRLASWVEAFRTDAHAVLLTPAAWTGLSLPGCIDHVVIPRIPFRPPSVEDEATHRFLEALGFPVSRIDGLIARDHGAAVRRNLAQGLGRGLRGPGERCTVWLLDPRFPLPKSMTRVIGGPDQGLAAKHLDLIHCIPARFRNGPRPAVDRGRIWPLARDT